MGSSVNYDMTNAELRAAIETTADQLIQKAFQPPINPSTKEILEAHLKNLTDIEFCRASSVEMVSGGGFSVEAE